MNNLEISLVSHDGENPFGIEDGLRQDRPFNHEQSLTSNDDGVGYDLHFNEYVHWPSP